MSEGQAELPLVAQEVAEPALPPRTKRQGAVSLHYAACAYCVSPHLQQR